MDKGNTVTTLHLDFSKLQDILIDMTETCGLMTIKSGRTLNSVLNINLEANPLWHPREL